jgi:hypothetical protein
MFRVVRHECLRRVRRARDEAADPGLAASAGRTRVCGEADEAGAVAVLLG